MIRYRYRGRCICGQEAAHVKFALAVHDDGSRLAARRLDVTRSLVDMIIVGMRCPGMISAAAIERTYSIKMQEWTTLRRAERDGRYGSCRACKCAAEINKEGLCLTCVIAFLRGGWTQPWDVLLGDKVINTVYHASHADGGALVEADDVRRDLINHDGFDARITVRRVHRQLGETPKSSANG